MSALAEATRRALQEYYAGFVRRLTAEMEKQNEPV
jgi:hypothetical protein